MKSKSSNIENSKASPVRKKRAASRNGNGKTSHGNGNGDSASHNDVFDSQPPISQLLARGGRHPSRELDKAKLLGALSALKKGDFSARLPLDLEGIEGKIADTFNDVVELNQRMADELERLSRVVGKEGKIGQRADIGEVSGSWKDSVKCVNNLISDLVHPINETGRVIGAVAKGDLSQSMAMEIDGRPLAGEFLRTAKIVNTMVDQLSSFASEVTRVAREVGTEGKLGGQAKVKGVAGTWKDLTDSVNSMAGNLTAQVRNIATVTTAVANGDLSKKITVDVKGEILE
jgi:HAMP domain-containing protein